MNRFNIPFKILNISKKIPPSPSIILTTTAEVKNLKKNHEDVNFLSYSNNENFEGYVLRVISAYRVGFRDFYSELTFGIDPGNKCGLIVFLDDYYLISHCCFDKQDLLNKIKNYIKYFQIDNPHQIKLTLKFGRGVLPVTQELVQETYHLFNERNDMKVLLIDEHKSSKIKIKHKTKEKKISKDEAAALILALRDGIEINQDNYRAIFNQIKSKKLKREEYKKENFKNRNENKIFSDEIAKIAENVLNGDITLTNSSQMIKEIRNNMQDIFKQ
ncbi:MAG: hypothetical protein EU532_14750 [Promethearchaeota archaeon]|nr:MAG: hypothetical protein EU532_14750 [Candidatus Lokiarchaeota archaeon]